MGVGGPQENRGSATEYISFRLLFYHTSFISMQVANDGYRAFNKAHTNMDKIRLQSMQTPENLKSTLQVLFKVRVLSQWSGPFLLP